MPANPICIALDCNFCYELRLHRARGYGALKAILDILADEEALTLTEISQRLQRTPGSTKDYLSWLEDVDLVHVRQKRYRFADPVLRLWVRLHCRTVPPTDDEIESHCREHLAAYKRPRRVAIVDALPRNASGKVLKSLLWTRSNARTPSPAASRRWSHPGQRCNTGPARSPTPSCAPSARPKKAKPACWNSSPARKPPSAIMYSA